MRAREFVHRPIAEFNQQAMLDPKGLNTPPEAGPVDPGAKPGSQSLNVPDDAVASGLSSAAASTKGISATLGKTASSSSSPTAPAATTPPAATPKASASVPSTFKNIVVPPEIGPPKSSSGVSLSGRTAASPEDVTHAYRLMSTGELQHAQTNGAFLPNPNANRANGWDTDHKYWSSGDAQGQFGRPWGGDARVAVRVPIDKVNPNTPVDVSHAHVQDKATGTWSPVVPPTGP
jgi:hypothetical protein